MHRTKVIACLFAICLVCMWTAAPASGQVCNPQCQPGQTCFSGCGTLFQGVSCVLFQADSGPVYLLSNSGGFVVGDRVEVTGCADSCINICLQGNGCVFNNTIVACPIGLGRCCFIGFVFPPYICQEMPQNQCASTVGGSWTAGATCATSCDTDLCITPGDANGDSVINALDIGAFVRCIVVGPVAGGNCPCAELDGVPGLTLGDVAVFVSALLA